MSFEKYLFDVKNIAVVGMGYWGQNLVRNYFALGALRVVCDTDPEPLQSVLTNCPGVWVTSNYQEVLDDPAVQGVVIALPAAAHYIYARRALEHGKDVYVEKPLTLDVSHGEELVELARCSNLILMTGHLLHYHPAFVKLRSLVTEGHLGKLQYLYSNRLSLGKIRREESSLWSFAPHDISMVLALTGQIPVQVQAFGATHLQPGIADVTTTHMTFEGGLSSHIFVSWLHPFKEHKLIVIADKAMAVFEDSQPWERKLALYPHSVRWSAGVPLTEKSTVEYLSVQPEEPLTVECQHFLDCIRTRKPPLTDGQEGLRVLKVLDRAQKTMVGPEGIRTVETCASEERGRSAGKAPER